MQDGFYPHYGDCTLFYECHRGRPMRVRCAEGLGYRQDLQTCDYIDNVPSCDGNVWRENIRNQENNFDAGNIFSNYKDNFDGYFENENPYESNTGIFSSGSYIVEKQDLSDKEIDEAEIKQNNPMEVELNDGARKISKQMFPTIELTEKTTDAYLMNDNQVTSTEPSVVGKSNIV